MNLTTNIGEKLVGEGYRPFIIAELSANHNQSLKTALSLVDVAANHGADAIKLQTFTPQILTLNSFKKEFYLPNEGSPWSGHRLWELYQKAYTPWEWHEPIFNHARQLGLSCISTAFDNSSVDFLVQSKVDAIKIASFELIHLPLIAHAAKTKLPIIISTGMGSFEEISEAVNTVKDNSESLPILLKCTSAYPALPIDANLKTILDFREKFEVLVGISDHTISTSVVSTAIALGACLVEKHITLSRLDKGVDSEFSLEPHEFGAMVTTAHECYQALGEIRYGKQLCETISAWERPSIWVTNCIMKGEHFTINNIRVLRPSGGIHPREFPNILGKSALCDIEAETPLIPSHFINQIPGDIK